MPSLTMTHSCQYDFIFSVENEIRSFDPSASSSCGFVFSRAADHFGITTNMNAKKIRRKGHCIFLYSKNGIRRKFLTASTNERTKEEKEILSRN